jgi:hypothetical protein
MARTPKPAPADADEQITDASIVVKLGGKDYRLPQLPVGRARTWRKGLEVPYQGIVSVMDSMKDMKIEKVEDLASMVKNLGGTLLTAPDLVYALVMEFAPEVFTPEERAWIDDHAYDEEIVTAFLACLRQVYPLGRLAASLGPLRAMTSSNSPALNGA